MGSFANTPLGKLFLFAIAGVIIFLNILLFCDLIKGLAAPALEPGVSPAGQAPP